ncbi:dystrobrevin beta-like isoform X1 [Tachypleus tridentatus]|uniref:dystrobrevin beta-like isoform X1 n=2 Tax=Tachypleus tridentatus TaxID=6853 RepID=UPI003FD07684
MMKRNFSDDVIAGSRCVDFPSLLADMKSQNFDVIRFATYRTASKLRFIQKKTNLSLLDIWNIIEAFRENSLNTLEPRMEINISRLETLLSSLFYQLNKRLPASHQVDINQCTSLLMNWILIMYDREDTGKVSVFSVKIALSIMCSGKLMDKLRYVFSLVCDASGYLMYSKFVDFLKVALALPSSVLESPTFAYNDSLPGTIFDGSKVTVNDFLHNLMSDPGPQCLIWLPLLHRMASVENVLHPVQCDGCNRESFLGFRYKCQRCYSYQLCQDCFWRGRVSGSHTSQHEMKEYTVYKSPTKQLSHSLRKSFRCVPEKHGQGIPRFPDEPEPTLNLSHIVPPSPIPSRNGLFDINNSYDLSSLDSHSVTKSSLQHTLSLESSQVDDEHRLIARYAAQLAGTQPTKRSPSDLSLNLDTLKQRELISQLEAKNREIMREIMRLRKQQEQEDAALKSEQNPILLAELRALRQRKAELETHLSNLQESRRELMVQLEGLMKLLKNHQSSPRSTPNSSPHSGTSKSPPLSTVYPLSSSRSAPTTPGSGAPTTDSLTGVGGDVRLAFGQSGSSRCLPNDLLVAADSVTNAMSSLVKELNSGSEDEEENGSRKVISNGRGFETEGSECATDSFKVGGTLWREERQLEQESHFLVELESRKLHTGNEKSSHLSLDPGTDNDNDPRSVPARCS